MEAQAGAMMAGILRDLELVLSMTPTGSPRHKDVMDAISKISRHAPAGISTADMTIRQIMQAASQVQRHAAMARQLGQARVSPAQIMAPNAPIGA